MISGAIVEQFARIKRAIEVKEEARHRERRRQQDFVERLFGPADDRPIVCSCPRMHGARHYRTDQCDPRRSDYMRAMRG